MSRRAEGLVDLDVKNRSHIVRPRSGQKKQLNGSPSVVLGCDQRGRDSAQRAALCVDQQQWLKGQEESIVMVMKQNVGQKTASCQR